MKKILQKKVRFQVSIQSLLILCFMLVFSSVAIGAVSTQIQATLDPGITVKFNGNVQTMQDANGVTIHPIVFNGTTYVPLRAVSNMFDVPVNWVAATRTVEIGEGGPGAAVTPGQPRSLFNHATGIGTSGGWDRITDVSTIPQPTPGTTTYTEALRHQRSSAATGINVSRSRWELDNTYSTLSFSVFVRADNAHSYIVTVTDITNDVTIASRTVSGNEFYTVDVDLNGAQNIGFTVHRQPVTGGNSEAFILNPTLR